MTIGAATSYKKLKLPTPPDIPLKDYSPVNRNEADIHRSNSADTEEGESEDDREETADPKAQLLESSSSLKPSQPPPSRHTRRNTAIMLTSACFLILGLVALVRASWFEKRATSSCECASTTTVPQYFQTTPEIFAGPTATGRAPFLAASNPAPFGPTGTFVANAPLETALPIVGNTQNQSIFHLMGQLSPYFANPTLVFFSLQRG